MFDVITKTWNPVIGCKHNCSYCWARNLAETRLAHMDKYKDGFKPNIAEYELKKNFVSNMCLLVTWVTCLVIGFLETGF